MRENHQPPIRQNEFMMNIIEGKVYGKRLEENNNKPHLKNIKHSTEISKYIKRIFK